MKKLKNSIISSQTRVASSTVSSDATVVLHEYEDGAFAVVTAEASQIKSVVPAGMDRKFAFDLFRKTQIKVFGKVVQDPETAEEI